MPGDIMSMVERRVIRQSQTQTAFRETHRNVRTNLPVISHLFYDFSSTKLKVRVDQVEIDGIICRGEGGAFHSDHFEYFLGNLD